MSDFKVSVARVTDQTDAKAGLRILVDRLWPRGLSKEKAKIDHWLKSIAPTTDLRQWYQHDPEKWPEFKQRYFEELNTNKSAVDELLKLAETSSVVLLYASKEAHLNNAVALKDYVSERQSSESSPKSRTFTL